MTTSFLIPANILIPSLTGIEMTLYNGDSDILYAFERQYCFLPQFQTFFTAAGLASFFENHSDDVIYEVQEPLGSWLILFRLQDRWALLGPYVENGWNDRTSRSLLAKLGVPDMMFAPFKSYQCRLPIAKREQILKTAMLMAQYADALSGSPMVKTIFLPAGQSQSTLRFLGAYEEVQVIQRRYALEDRFLLAVSRGETKDAIRLLKEIHMATFDLRFVSEHIQDQIAGAAIFRTLIRLGAKWAGLSPVLIDSISQEYAQKMQHATTTDELSLLMLKLTEYICTQIRILLESGNSIPVRRAMEYMETNLSDPMTIAQIAHAAGMERHQLTRSFYQETGMTVKQYLGQKRCDLAADLLANSHVSIQEIASYVGYPDSNYFTKVFKAYYGMPPQKWRENHGLPESDKKT